MELIQQKCANCMFSRLLVRKEFIRVCARYAPRPHLVVGQEAYLRYLEWPGVTEDDWCGEWAASPHEI